MIGIINFVFTIIAILYVDRWGRRPLLVGGMAAVTIWLVATAILLLVHADPRWIVLLLCLFMVSVALSICEVVGIIPEIFPNRIRGRATSLATFAVWSTNMLIVLVFPRLVHAFGVDIAFFTHAAICLIATVFF